MAIPPLPPVPESAALLNEAGMLNPVWSGWFRQIFTRVGGTLGNTPAGYAAAAAVSAGQAAASDTDAIAKASAAASSATAAAGSATAAAASATSAASSAATTAGLVSTAQALIDLAGAQAYSPDYISDTVAVPVHRQLVAFQRITIASGGSLQFSGRGRIL